MELHDIILRCLEAGDTDEKVRAAVLAQYPEATEHDIGSAYLRAADLFRQRATRHHTEVERHRRAADIRFALRDELVEISLETGIPLRSDTVDLDFVREAAATGNRRALALLNKFNRS
jgi:hypothetical protein